MSIYYSRYKSSRMKKHIADTKAINVEIQKPYL